MAWLKAVSRALWTRVQWLFNNHRRLLTYWTENNRLLGFLVWHRNKNLCHSVINWWNIFFWGCLKKNVDVFQVFLTGWRCHTEGWSWSPAHFLGGLVSVWDSVLTSLDNVFVSVSAVLTTTLIFSFHLLCSPWLGESALPAPRFYRFYGFYGFDIYLLCRWSTAPITPPFGGVLMKRVMSNQEVYLSCKYILFFKRFWDNKTMIYSPILSSRSLFWRHSWMVKYGFEKTQNTNNTDPDSK